MTETRTHRVAPPLDYPQRYRIARRHFGYRTLSDRIHDLFGMDRIRAMPSARAATPSEPSLLRVSGIAGIAIAAFCVVYFGLQLARLV